MTSSSVPGVFGWMPTSFLLSEWNASTSTKAPGPVCDRSNVAARGVVSASRSCCSGRAASGRTVQVDERDVAPLWRIRAAVHRLLVQPLPLERHVVELNNAPPGRRGAPREQQHDESSPAAAVGDHPFPHLRDAGLPGAARASREVGCEIAIWYSNEPRHMG